MMTGELVDEALTIIQSVIWMHLSRLDYIDAATKRQRKKNLSLVDGGTNCGIAGHYMRPMDDPYPSDPFTIIFGVTHHVINNKRIVSYCAVSPSNYGYCLFIYPEYAQVFKQPTSIHSKIQIWYYSNNVSNFPALLGGSQSVITPTGHIFPLVIEGGLFYLSQHLPTDCEMRELPQVLMVSSRPWDPAGTRGDNYDTESNTVFSADIDATGNINVPTVDDDGNTITSLLDDRTKSTIGIDLDGSFFDTHDGATFFSKSNGYKAVNNHCDVALDKIDCNINVTNNEDEIANIETDDNVMDYSGNNNDKISPSASFIGTDMYVN